MYVCDTSSNSLSYGRPGHHQYLVYWQYLSSAVKWNVHGIITIKHTHLIYAPWLLLLCLTDPACYTASCVGNRLATEENITEKKKKQKFISRSWCVGWRNWRQDKCFVFAKSSNKHWQVNVFSVNSERMRNARGVKIKMQNSACLLTWQDWTPRLGELRHGEWTHSEVCLVFRRILLLSEKRS